MKDDTIQFQKLLIKAENDQLMGGRLQNLMVSFFDDHESHIRSHKKILHDPKNRQNVELIKNTINHMLRHEEMLKNIQNVLKRPRR